MILEPIGLLINPIFHHFNDLVPFHHLKDFFPIIFLLFEHRDYFHLFKNFLSLNCQLNCYRFFNFYCFNFSEIHRLERFLHFHLNHREEFNRFNHRLLFHPNIPDHLYLNLTCKFFNKFKNFKIK
jgi:hypothetical protein